MNEHRDPTGRIHLDQEDLIEALARTSYNFRAFLKEDDIRIEVYRDISGKDLMSRLAGQIKGVKLVNNRMTLPPG